jgi:hypothetical protein
VPEAKEISILDVEGFICSMPYEAGLTINEAEARVLNQTRRENLGNNFRKLVSAYKEQDEGALTLEELHAKFAAADADYAFTLSNVSASVKYTPIEREARNIARAYIRQELDKEGRKIGDAPEGVPQEEWDDLVESQVNEIASNPEVVAIATETVQARSKTAGLQLGALAVGGGKKKK